MLKLQWYSRGVSLMPYHYTEGQEWLELSDKEVAALIKGLQSYRPGERQTLTIDIDAKEWVLV